MPTRHAVSSLPACLAVALFAACATTPRPGRPDCDGAFVNGKKKCLSQSDIMAVAMQHKEQVGACVDRQQSKRVGWRSGLLVLGWTIQLSGETTDVMVVREGESSSEIGRCMVDAVSSWKFPEVVEPTKRIEFPVKF